ncbi:MAG TPA: CPBP family intramembrane glutamic endopeptidase [Sphingomicrobium sp.]|nr:CPBP family intramembrane glutamic endopeptidase [Sphingomicrobium sp.]
MRETLKTFARQATDLLWRLTVYFALLIAAFWALSKGYSWAKNAFGVQFVSAPGVRPAEAVALGQLRLLIAALFAWFVTARLGRDRAASIMPLRANAIAHLLQGSLWGLAGIAATIGLIAWFGGYRVTGAALSGAAFYYVPLWLVIALVNGAAENLAILGYPMCRIAKAAGWLPAVLVASALFAAAHLGNPGESPIGIASVFLIALIMAVTIWLTGDLWLSVGIHAGLIIGEDLIFSVPDSGATYTGHLLVSRLAGPPWLSGGEGGPEASIVAFPVFLALLVLLWLVYRGDAPAKPRAGFQSATSSSGAGVRT